MAPNDGEPAEYSFLTIVTAPDRAWSRDSRTKPHPLRGGCGFVISAGQLDPPAMVSSIHALNAVTSV